MKNLIILTSILLLSYFLPSCKKEDDTTTPFTNATVQGRILQVYSTIPVPNATVYLYETISSTSFGGGANTVVLDTTISNDKGEYSFDYKRGSISNEYFIRAFAENFDKKPGNFYITQKNSPGFDVPIFPYAWIKVRVVNLPPVSSNDHIRLSGFGNDINDFYAYGACDTTFTKKVNGNVKNIIDVWSISNSKLNRKDSIYCKGLDTTYHSITY